MQQHIEHVMIEPYSMRELEQEAYIKQEYIDNLYSGLSKICKKLKIEKQPAEALGYCIAWTYLENVWDQEAQYMVNHCELTNHECAALVSEEYFEKNYGQLT
jgi:hypothetical protein